MYSDLLEDYYMHMFLGDIYVHTYVCTYNTYVQIAIIVWSYSSGYGFVDFESAADAQMAVSTLQSLGILAQFAKVRPTHLSSWPPPFILPRKHLNFCSLECTYVHTYVHMYHMLLLGI